VDWWWATTSKSEIERAWDEVEDTASTKKGASELERFAAFTPKRLQRMCNTTWGGIQLPLNLRAFLLTPGCYYIPPDATLLCPSGFSYDTSKEWAWDFDFGEDLTEDNMKRWLWLQGQDESRASELITSIKKAWQDGIDDSGVVFRTSVSQGQSLS